MRDTLKSLPAGSLYYQQDFIKVFDTLCTYIEKVEQDDSVVENTEIHFKQLLKELDDQNTETARFAKKVASERLLDADNSTVSIMRLHQLLQPTFKVEEYTPRQIRILCIRINKLFDSIIEPIDSEILIQHYQRPQCENTRRYFTAMEMWEDRGYNNITTFLEYCTVMQVSECPVERTFSEMGHLIGQRRYNLSPEMLHDTFMIKDCAHEQYEQQAEKQERESKQLEGPTKLSPAYKQ
ncbi:Hypothetical_protein [Hexamita inflata]|nr:Hypothetical protein HINF_LOCUS26306 [Hexamita inflata]